ncbi:MAG: KpsF/GutQ family sugar-phosphate isomerase [Deltaproteobacteria bacterium]|nr:KpsF/GutQ family sugar-phosphate isomerase [Candidatus Zymogenaceae bacterium]
MNPIDEGKTVLDIEQGAIGALRDRLGSEFSRALDLFYETTGRVIITGIGKSGLVGRKIAATLSSTGTPAVYLHPAEGLHGDLGVVTTDDLVVAISYSGESDEILRLFPYFRWVGVKIIGMTGSKDSRLARESDVVLDVWVEKEACPWDIVPTSSTTLMMALGDALAVVLLKMRGFNLEDFAKRHPGGAIGRRVLLSVADLMHAGDECPRVERSTLLKDAIYEMTSKGLGMTTVIGEGGRLSGIVTDGDLRRIFQNHPAPLDMKVGEFIAGKGIPRTIEAEKLAAEALRVMEDNAITSLVVPDDEGRPRGVIHIHDILKAGITL